MTSSFASATVAAAALSAALLSGCARSKDKSGAGAALADASVASLAAPTPTLSAAAPGASGVSSAAAPYGQAFAGRLASEAAVRPTDTPKAEDVLAAIAKAGIPLQDQAQHLASPIGAKYCVGATSPQNLKMSACEYADALSATSGRDVSVKAFGKIEHRDVVVNKKTTLTILQSPYSPESQAAHDKAVAAFTKL